MVVDLFYCKYTDNIFITIERILEHLPAQQARSYSISSWSESGNSYDLVFSVVDIPQEDVRRYPRKGISTGWLQQFCESENETLPINIYKRNKKAFAPPLDLQKSYIMIGAGTGVAPFRGFLQQREFQYKKQAESTSAQLGNTWLIFGCRDSKLDFIYQEEMEHFKKCAILSRMDCAFSRENDKIKYVQDVIKANAADVANYIIQNNARIYVCGDADMAKEVQESIIQAIFIESDLTDPEARNKVADMKLNEEYLQDIW